MIDPITALPVSTPPDRNDTAALRSVSQELEATFLAEMLKSAGFGQARESFGGGAGEDQFASILVLEQAKAMVDAGGIGLAEHLFKRFEGAPNQWMI